VQQQSYEESALNISFLDERLLQWDCAFFTILLEECRWINLLFVNVVVGNTGIAIYL